MIMLRTIICRAGTRWCWGELCWGGPIPRLRPTLCASLHSRNALGHVTRAASENSQVSGPHFAQASENAPAIATQICAKLRSQDALGRFIKNHFLREFTGKMPHTRPRCRLRASLRIRSALRHSTRATLYENLQVKCRKPKLRRKLCASMNFNIAQEPFYEKILTRCLMVCWTRFPSSWHQPTSW